MQFDRNRVAAAVGDLARKGVFIGTSSWKYPGWCGQLYDERRYYWRGRFTERRFEQHCLEEYSEVFKTVCVDAAYYKFPEARYLDDLIAQVPGDFLFGFKVTDEITIKRYPDLPRFGARAGKFNPNFLNAELFRESFLEPCGHCRERVGLLVFEFSRFQPWDFRGWEEFLEALDQFLGGLPTGWPYGVEIRNPELLTSGYFAVLRRHAVAHIYNSWGGMPAVEEQMSMAGSDTGTSVSGARLLLKPGRSYEEAVKLFAPYRETKEVNEPARKAAAALVKRALASRPEQRMFIFVNNRLEGNALNTISAILEEAVGLPEPAPEEESRRPPPKEGFLDLGV